MTSHAPPASGAADAPAICAPGMTPLTHGALRQQTAGIATKLRWRGIGRSDPVAMVLPNGPTAATAFLGVSAGAIAAPLNPAYRADELRFFLGDLKARALLVNEFEDGSAVAVARELGLAIIRTVESTEVAGAFDLTGPTPTGSAAPDAAEAGESLPADIALMLHTSGTTSRPKLVPLSHGNLAASARNIAATLELGPGDRCLNVMPLFHIHGLVAAVLAPLSAGGSVSCTPGFNATRFFSWLASEEPTWFTAVPTMHQAILLRAPRNTAAATDARLRFIRSSSAALPAPVMAELETVFGCPVVESYGMTEAAHQMASNHLPPGERHPGLVGVAAGPEIAIMDTAGRLLPPETVGEIVIRGDNVTAGYVENADANAAAFCNGWFRTGDQGVMDSAGRLRITGRLKEIINRGGEKIAPLEIDNVLMEHPDVHQAVAFAVPHDMLGEDIAAAIIPRDGVSLSEHTLRDFARARLAGFKVPARILLVDDIPKGVTGKLNRSALPDLLGLSTPARRSG